MRAPTPASETPPWTKIQPEPHSQLSVRSVYTSLLKTVQYSIWLPFVNTDYMSAVEELKLCFFV